MVLVYFFVSLFTQSQIGAYDTMWHIRTGDLLLSGQFPHTDIFSYTAYGREWILHEWGSEVLFALFYRWSGWNGLVVLRSLIGSITLGVMFRILQKRNVNLFLAILMTIIFCLELLTIWNTRPHLFSALFFTYLLYLYDAYRRRESRLIYALPLLFMLWINMHGGYVIGFIFLLTALGGESLSLALNLDDQRTMSPRKLVTLLAITSVSFLFCFINPLGAKLVFYPLMYLGDKIGDFHNFITEWQVSSFINAAGFIVLVMATCFFALVSRKKMPLYEVLAVLVFMFLSFKANRHDVLFAIVAVPAISPLIEDVLSRFARQWHERTTGWLQTSLGSIRYYFCSRSTSFLKKEEQLFNPAILAVELLLVLFVSMNVLPPVINARLLPGQYPTKTLLFLKEHPDLPGNLFNQYAWGGIIIKELPEKKVFIDGRADVYQKDIIEKYFNMIALKANWKHLLRDYNITQILVDPNQMMARFLPGIDPNWRVMEKDESSVLLYNGESLPASTSDTADE